MGSIEAGIRGKKAIVTGGTKGIGRSIVSMLLEEGAQVVFCGRTQSGVDQALEQLRKEQGSDAKVFGQACDVTRAEDIIRFFRYSDDSLTSLDILVNNAGIGIFRPVAEMTPEDWERVIATNLTGVFHFSRLALERFRRNGSGFVVNISSLAAKNTFAGGAAYNASKFGLNGFAEAMMLDHRRENIRVCSVMPGSVSTEFGGGLADWKVQPEDVAAVVRMVLTMPERTMVSQVEMRPSKPMK
ncbi:MAG: SDR family oxidoreductase [Candidatus Solibacter usitatus]|nr:SDR family oxidoreductase [Candidatus Solibacter usitatus]